MPENNAKDDETSQLPLLILVTPVVLSGLFVAPLITSRLDLETQYLEQWSGVMLSFFPGFLVGFPLLRKLNIESFRSNVAVVKGIGFWSALFFLVGLAGAFGLVPFEYSTSAS